MSVKVRNNTDMWIHCARKYIDDYVKRQIELDPTYGAEFRTEEDGRFDD